MRNIVTKWSVRKKKVPQLKKGFELQEGLKYIFETIDLTMATYSTTININEYILE